MLVMDVFTRGIVGFGVESVCIDGISVCRMFNHASMGQRPPSHASTDHDLLFRLHRWLANLRVLEMEEIKSVPYAPVSHPYVERLIGTSPARVLCSGIFLERRRPGPQAGPIQGLRQCASCPPLDGTTPAQRAGASAPALASLDRHAWRQHWSISHPNGRLIGNSPRTR